MSANLEVVIGQKIRKYKHVRPFNAAVKDPATAQLNKLLEIVRANENSAFGKKHGFDRVRSVKDYQSAVPPANYEDLYPYIEASMNGEPNQLTCLPPFMFATTSGTTDKPKFIPITTSHLRDYTHAFQIHNYHMIEDYPDGATGKFLIITSNDVQGRTPCGTPYGAVSGLLQRQQPPIIKKYFALPYELCKIKEVETKYYLMLRIAAAQNVTALCCCNPSSLLLMFDQLREHAQEIVRDVYQGRIAPEYAPDSSIAEAFEEYVRPNRTAARRLNTILERQGTLRPEDLWPELCLISCWKGGPMSFYLERLPQMFGTVPVRDFGYMASEGRGSIPLSNEGAGGVLALTSHFFEFVAESEMTSSTPVFLTADELELHGRYYIYFTTASGLYRYNINDLVEVVGFYGRTPLIQFVRKGVGISSITGEKITEEQVRKALSQAVQELGLSEIAHFTVAVQLRSLPYYACFVELDGSLSDSVSREFIREFDGSLSDSVSRQFIREFDSSLMAQNPEYEDKRNSKRLGAPKLQILPAGTYRALRQKRVDNGAPEAQVKIPLLAQAGQFQVNEVGQLV